LNGSAASSGYQPSGIGGTKVLHSCPPKASIRCARIAFVFTDMPSSRLLSVGEVAKLLRLHPHSVYRKINAGALPAIRLGGDGPLRVRSDKLEAWLTQYPASPAEGRRNERA
jgi:excisionase family DNA binding protein